MHVVVMMSKGLIGLLDVEGEKIAYVFKRTYRLPKGNEWNFSIEAEYCGEHIVIDDHGGGLEYAKNLLMNNIMMKKQSKKPSL
jgi:hypothetical protein